MIVMPKSVQLNLPPTPVRKSEPAETTFRKTEHEPAASWNAERDEASVLASELFDDALTASRLTNKEVAHLLGISESLVQKMRSRESRGCPSFAQLLKLPPSFHIELHRAMNRRFGFGRAALLRLLEAAGDLAAVVPI